jgi:hypothetical protein
MNPSFEWYIGIDYSGAQTPTSSLKGRRVYAADRLTAPQEVESPRSPRKYWTRRGITEWLVERLSEGPPTLVGIDHGFSFPLQYFEQHGFWYCGRCGENNPFHFGVTSGHEYVRRPVDVDLVCFYPERSLQNRPTVVRAEPAKRGWPSTSFFCPGTPGLGKSDL